MIQVIQGFKLSTREAIDNRIVLTKAQMVAINDNQMPDIYFAWCKDDAKLYIYDKSLDALEDTGKFRIYETDAIDSISVDGSPLPMDRDRNVNLPLASADVFGLVKPGQGLAISEDGFLIPDFDALADGIIPMEKIDFTGAIIDGNNTSV